MNDCNAPKHLLTELGILANFTISKTINKKEIKRIRKSIEKASKALTPEEFQKNMEKALLEHTKKYLTSYIPPGFIFNKTDEQTNQNQMYSKLFDVAKQLSHNWKDYDKHQLCFLITSLINLRKLISDDFEDFNKKYNEFKKNSGFDDLSEIE